MALGETSREMFQKVRLVTSAGHLVTTVWVPRFNVAPDVIFWGERVFVPTNTVYDHGEPNYREAFAFAATELA